MIKSYTELCSYNTYEERFNYLMLHGVTCAPETEQYRSLFQQFYNTNSLWRNHVRKKIIVRDRGCDLGIYGHEILGERVLIHHINPITVDDIMHNNLAKLLDPDNLICVSHSTHNAIHYGLNNTLVTLYSDRSPNDTCPWK